MDDIQSNEPAADELLAGSDQSEANTEEETPKDAAEKGDDGAADDAEADKSKDDESDDEDDDKPKRKSRNGSDRWRRRAEALEAELQMTRSRLPVQAGSGDVDAAVRAEVGDPPKEAEYPDFLSYERAMIAYEADKRLVTREVRKQFATQAAQEQARMAEAAETYQERIAEAEKAVPGLAAAIAKADIQVRNDIGQLIVESDKGPLLAHHLAKNPAKAAELNAMSPVAAAREIGRLEARLSFPKTQTATKAPSPVSPPKGGAGVLSPSQEIEAYIRRTYGRR